MIARQLIFNSATDQRIAAGLTRRDQDHNLEKEFNSVINTGDEPNA